MGLARGMRQPRQRQRDSQPQAQAFRHRLHHHQNLPPAIYADNSLDPHFCAATPLKIFSGATISFIVRPYLVLAMTIQSAVLALALLAALTGCEELGIPDPVKEAARAQAEGEAIGSACRYAGRALEDCFSLNPKASKADIFNGWRNMNDYMTENKIDVVPPTMTEAPSHEKTAEAPSAAPDEHASEPASPRPRYNRRP
ncbi:hypothetical protein [Denitromonas sp.]|uniref:hypothetical protein n=1 Tax=Denitromonas sp. TaxID=2734609 RepID=UPI002FDC7B14